MKKRIYFMFTGILSAACVCFLSACSADEEVLFVENSEMMLAGTDSEAATEVSGQEDGIPVLEEEETSGQPVVFVEDAKITVHVCGAVQSCGVYELGEGSRVMDAVLAAGGFLEDADEEYVNLATLLADGDKVRIPTQNETAELAAGDGISEVGGVIGPGSMEETENAVQKKVNINTADAQELCTLPGIGQTRAESILSYRNEHGGFVRIEDIMQVSGIKENSFEKIKDKITVK